MSPPPLLIISQLITEFSWSHASAIVGVIALVLLLVAVYLLYRSRSNKGSLIALEGTSGGECVMIPLVPLSLCPSYYTITIPSILDISASKFPSFYLEATWENFSVTDKQTEATLTVPSKVTLNPFAHRKLTKLLQQPFMAYVVILHNNYAFYLDE